MFLCWWNESCSSHLVEVTFSFFIIIVVGLIIELFIDNVFVNVNVFVQGCPGEPGLPGFKGDKVREPVQPKFTVWSS